MNDLRSNGGLEDSQLFIGTTNLFHVMLYIGKKATKKSILTKDTESIFARGGK